MIITPRMFDCEIGSRIRLLLMKHRIIDYCHNYCVLCSDLQVESPERVTEGDSVRLTCKSSCALTDRETFIWYRNSQTLTERRDGNNQLLLQSVRREDAGRYSCAVHGHSSQIATNCRHRSGPHLARVEWWSGPHVAWNDGTWVDRSCLPDQGPKAGHINATCQERAKK